MEVWGFSTLLKYVTLSIYKYSVMATKPLSDVIKLQRTTISSDENAALLAGINSAKTEISALKSAHYKFKLNAIKLSYIPLQQNIISGEKKF